VKPANNPQEHEMEHLQPRPAEDGGGAPASSQIRVWDLPVRLFHWLMAFSFAGAYLTAEMDNWRLLHVTLGYTMAALVGFRLLWGIFGTRYARFASFVRGPRATFTYMRSLLEGRPQHFTGHNPAGAVAIILMLTLATAVAGSGWPLYASHAGEWMEEVHELAANLMLGVVVLHVAGVLASSVLHRENLAKAMITGHKRAADGAASQPRRAGAALMLLLAVLGFWWWQGKHADAPAYGVTSPARQHGHHDDDD
jgi:cytochrome b